MNADPSLADVLNEELLGIRKVFGMRGRISWHILDVDDDTITVAISTGRPARGPDVALDVRNALLGFLQDVLPAIRRCKVLFERQGPEPVREEHVLDFGYSKDEELPSSAILIEDVVGPHRERIRPVARRMWRKEAEARRRARRRA